MSIKDDFADMRLTIEALREAREAIERLEAEKKALQKRIDYFEWENHTFP